MIRIGPAGAPRWFDQSPDRLTEYLDHIVAHGAGCIEFVVHGGAPGEEAERVHLPRRNWATAVSESRRRGLDVHLHAPLTPEYRVSNWLTQPAGLKDLFLPIIDLLLDVERTQDQPPVRVLHAASVADRDSTEGEQATGEFISWLLDQLVTRRSSARIAVELRLRRDDQDTRFDRQLPSLSRFVAGFGTRLVGVCWDIANFLGAGGQIAAIEPDTLEQIGHVHLHDSHREGRGFHAPLRADGLPWPTAIGRLLAVNWSGAVTLEIRYRYATEQGEPWLVLGESLERVHQVLKEE